MNSGGIRGDLMFGNITYADMLTVVKIQIAYNFSHYEKYGNFEIFKKFQLPFQTSVDIFELKGKHLKEAFETSAEKLGEGGFLQVRVEFPN